MNDITKHHLARAVESMGDAMGEANEAVKQLVDRFTKTETCDGSCVIKAKKIRAEAVPVEGREVPYIVLHNADCTGSTERPRTQRELFVDWLRSQPGASFFKRLT